MDLPFLFHVMRHFVMISCVCRGYFILFSTLWYKKFDEFFFKTLGKIVKLTLEKHVPKKIKKKKNKFDPNFFLVHNFYLKKIVKQKSLPMLLVKETLLLICNYKSSSHLIEILIVMIHVKLVYKKIIIFTST